MHYYILTVQIPHETLYTHGPTPGGRELIGNGGKKKKKDADTRDSANRPVV